MTPPGTLIVGAGQAGFELASSLRTLGYDRPIHIVGEEPHLPYQRPPLSKGFLLGQQTREVLNLRPASFFVDHQIATLVGERVDSIDLNRSSVQLRSGGRLSFDDLVLAVGARNRILPIEGASLDGVVYLRTLDEAIHIAQRLSSASSVAIIGGGFIGLELASVAAGLGKEVTIIEAEARLMPRAVGPAISQFFHQLHLEKGIRVRCGSAVTKIQKAASDALLVHLNDGSLLQVDLVLVGIGVMPNTELAEAAGLSVSNGISVNNRMQTSHRRVYSVGDCAEHPNRYASGRIRLESVQNSTDQARIAAAAIAGRDDTYDMPPWFWTDQHGLRLQMAGLSQGFEHAVTHGNVEEHKFSVFYFTENRLIAVDSIGRPADHIAARKLLSVRGCTTPYDDVIGHGFDLKSLINVNSATDSGRRA